MILALLAGIAVGLAPIGSHATRDRWYLLVLGVIAVFPLGLAMRDLLRKLGSVGFLWLLLVITTSLTFRYRDPWILATADAADAQVLARLALFAICGIFGFVLFLQQPRQLILVAITPPMKWLALYALLALASISYSEYPLVTLASSLQFIAALTLLGAAITRGDMSSRRLLNTTLLGIFIIEIAVWFLYFIAPEWVMTSRYSISPRLGGLLITANALAAAAATSGVVMLTRTLTATTRLSRFGCALLFFISVLTLIATQGRASMIALILGSAVVLVLMRRGFLLLIVMLAIVTVVIFVPESINSGVDVFEGGRDVRGLTGRIPLWQFVLSEAGNSAQTLLIGRGHGASRLYLLEELAGPWTDAHNAFLEALLGLGLFGATVLAISIFSAGSFLFRVVIAGRSEEFGHYVELTGVLVVIFGVAMAIAAIESRPGIQLFIFITVLSCCARLRIEANMRRRGLPQYQSGNAYSY